MLEVKATAEGSDRRRQSTRVRHRVFKLRHGAAPEAKRLFSDAGGCAII